MHGLHACSCSAAGRLLICRDRGQLNFPCDSCCSRCSQSSLQCSHLPPFARCANHFRVAINRYRVPQTRSHYSHNLITKYRILTAWRSNTSTCSYCMHSAESCTCFSLWWRLQSSAVIESVWCVYLNSFFPEVTCCIFPLHIVIRFWTFNISVNLNIYWRVYCIVCAALSLSAVSCVKTAAAAGTPQCRDCQETQLVWRSH